MLQFMMNDLFISKLQEKGLKVTPQRLAIYDAIVQLKNHPTAENIIEYIKLWVSSIYTYDLLYF